MSNFVCAYCGRQVRPSEFDYRELLKKYMRVVGQKEGIDFAPISGETAYDWLSEDECAELAKLSAESQRDNPSYMCWPLV